MLLQKRLAAQLLKCSQKRIWLDPEKLAEIKEAITKFDIRRLINTKLIKKVQATGVSRVRAKKAQVQKSRGRQRGAGSRKGKAGARSPKKENWMSRIRTQRRLLSVLKKKSIIKPAVYRMLYAKSKGGFFRSKRHLKMCLEDAKK